MNLLTPHEVLAIVKHTKRFKNIFISLQSHPRAKIWIDRILLHPTYDSIINVFQSEIKVRNIHNNGKGTWVRMTEIDVYYSYYMDWNQANSAKYKLIRI